LIDPISAFAVATTAYKTISSAVAVGQDIENVTGQLGKWFTAVGDIRKAQEMNKRAPLFKKVFAAGSVEEEALQLLIHEKKIQEMESELRTLLNFRYGQTTWEEMIAMRRNIKAQREKEVYRVMEIKRNILEGVAIIGLMLLCAGLVFGIAYLYVNR
jgi:hypothetical protein